MRTTDPRAGAVRALSLHQPWATLYALGEKKNETRSWPTRFRGTLLVHASRAKPNAQALENPHIARALMRHGYYSPSDLPTGCILARTEIAGCSQVWPVQDAAGAWHPLVEIGRAKGIPDELEQAFGDFSVGRWIWWSEPDSLRTLLMPIDCTGRQGLWIPDETTVARALSGPAAERFGGTVVWGAR